MNLCEAAARNIASNIAREAAPLRVTGLKGDEVLLARLRELGFIVGEPLVIEGTAAIFGEPILIEIRGSTVALRKSEAECVLV
jgi:ferrous iron transport protein A